MLTVIGHFLVPEPSVLYSPRITGCLSHLSDPASQVQVDYSRLRCAVADTDTDIHDSSGLTQWTHIIYQI